MSEQVLESPSLMNRRVYARSERGIEGVRLCREIVWSLTDSATQCNCNTNIPFLRRRFTDEKIN